MRRIELFLLLLLVFLPACSGPLQVRTGSNAQATDIALGKTMGVAELCKTRPQACGTQVPEGFGLQDFGRVGSASTPQPKAVLGTITINQTVPLYDNPGEGDTVKKVGELTNTAIAYDYVATASNGRYILVAVKGYMEKLDVTGGTMTSCVSQVWDATERDQEGALIPVCYAYAWEKGPGASDAEARSHGAPDRIMDARLAKGLPVSKYGEDVWEEMTRMVVYAWVRVNAEQMVVATATPVPSQTAVPTPSITPTR